MQRFYVPPENNKQDKVIFTPEQAKYITKVLRMREGTEIAVTDGLGRAYLCRLLSFSIRGGEGQIVSPLEESREPKRRVVLYQALSKGDKMDQVVQKSVELGVAEIAPMLSHRCVVKLEKEKGQERRQRWQKIAVSALEQSGRSMLTRVHLPVAFSQAVQDTLPSEGTLTLIPWEEETSTSLRCVLEKNPDPEVVRVFIGPEGGFTQEEVDNSRSKGAIPVTLGPRILRTETSGPTVIALILYHYGDMG